MGNLLSVGRSNISLLVDISMFNPTWHSAYRDAFNPVRTLVKKNFDKLYCAIKKSSSSYLLTILCFVTTIFIINVINYVYHIIFYDSYLILGHKFDPGVIARTLHVLMAINFPPFIILSHMPYARHWFLCLNLQSNLPLNQQSKLIVRFSHITKHWLINYNFMFVWIHTIEYFWFWFYKKK